MRYRYHFHTSSGCRVNIEKVAISCGWYTCEPTVQYPSGPRKVGMPLSAEMPAPVSTVILPSPRAMVASIFLMSSRMVFS